MNEMNRTVTASLVPNSDRLKFYSEMFGQSLIMRGEALIFGYMTHLSDNYDGGFWHFYTLSNGGYYMAPAVDSPLNISVPGNYFSGSMSADAAGIVANLFALGYLCSENQDSPEGDILIDHYHYLREYALYHAEGSAILSAID